jgi:hypothetical protein
MDQGIHLGVNRPAKLIVLAGRNIFFLANAIPKVDTVGGLPRGAIIAGADYLIVFDDYRAESAPKTRAAHCHSAGDIHVILALGRSFHFCLMSYDLNATLAPGTGFRGPLKNRPAQNPESTIRNPACDVRDLFRPPATKNSIRK